MIVAKNARSRWKVSDSLVLLPNKGFLVQTAENKKALNEEFKEKYGQLKENCFPRPGKGCRCTEKDASGHDKEKLYDSDADCKVFFGVYFEKDLLYLRYPEYVDSRLAKTSETLCARGLRKIMRR